MATLPDVELPEHVQHYAECWVVSPDRLFNDANGAGQIWLRVGQAPFEHVELRNSPKTLSEVGIVWAKHLLAKSERLFGKIEKLDRRFRRY